MHGKLPQGETKTRARRGRRWLVSTLVLIAIAGALYWVYSGSPAPQRNFRRFAAQGPVPVLVAQAKRADVPVYLTTVGTARALNTVTVRPQVDGKLISINFKEGQDVKKGDVLAKIDPTIYQAQYDQALAKKAQDEAQLANASNDLERYQKLVAINAINKQQADTQKALVAQYSALVQADKAAIENVQATLSYTTITAPISGRTGILPGRRRQLRARFRQRIGHRHHYRDQADRGLVQSAAAGPDAGERGLRQGPAAGRGAALRQQQDHRPRHADRGRQHRSIPRPARSS